MPSAKQIAANRANAKKSTGPKSAEGRARSSQNSRKHGLTASRMMFDGEDPEDFKDLCEGLKGEYNPQTIVEQELVSYLASLFWRLRRVPHYEVQIALKEDQTVQAKAKRQDRLVAIADAFRMPRRPATGDEDAKAPEKPVVEPAPQKIAPIEDERPSFSFVRELVNREALAQLERHEASLINRVMRVINQIRELKRK